MGLEIVAEKVLKIRCRDEAGALLFDASGGHVYRTAERGDPIPEAVYWPNIQFWISTGQVSHAHTFVPELPNQRLGVPRGDRTAAAPPPAPEPTAPERGRRRVRMADAHA